MTNLKQLAQKTLTIAQTGKLPTNDGVVDFLKEQNFAQDNTRVFSPDELQAIFETISANPPQNSTRQTEVWACSTQEAAYRLGGDDVVLLNFASAKNVGGGFLGGAKAQEEDLCRASGLYLCQRPQETYYKANKAFGSAIYTDYMMYSPKVPFFRTDNDNLLDKPFLASVITAPAPNMGAYLAKHPQGQDDIQTAFIRRTGLLLALMHHLGYKNLILGAWGCGVFKNDPAFVARVFADWLDDLVFQRAFDKVVFAIYDKSKDKRTLTAFERVFDG